MARDHDSDLDHDPYAERHPASGGGLGAIFRLVSWLVAGGLAVGVVWWTHRDYQTRVESGQMRVWLAEHRLRYVASDELVRQIADPTGYADARRDLFRWYFGEIDKKRPEAEKTQPHWFDPDKKLAAIQAESKEGALDAKQLPTFERAFGLARESYQGLTGGKYGVVATDVKGPMRLDIVRIGKQQVNGVDRLKFDFMLFGMLPDLQFGAISFEVLNENGNMFASLSGQGAPNLILRNPDQQIDTYPPQIAFGSYDFDLLPSVGKFITLRLTYSARVPGGQGAQWEFAFEKLPVESDWIAPQDDAWAPEPTADSPMVDAKGQPLSARERLEAAAKEADRVAKEKADEEAKAAKLAGRKAASAE